MKKLILISALLFSQFSNADTIAVDTTYNFSGLISNTVSSGSLLNGNIQNGDTFSGSLQYNKADVSSIHLDVSVNGFDFTPAVGQFVATNGVNTDVLTFSSNSIPDFANTSYAFVTLSFIDNTGTLLNNPVTTLPDYNMLMGFDAVTLNIEQNGFNNSGFTSYNLSGNVSAVPIPAAAWLFMSGLLGLVAVSRRKA